MTKRTRAFVLTASAIVAVGVGTAGVASYMGFERLGLNRQGSHELSFLPATAALVAYVDVRHVMDSALRQRLQAATGVSERGPDQLLERTGINIETDVDSVFAAVLASDVAAGQAPARTGQMPVLLARGRFDRDRIESAMLAQNGAATQYNGTWIVTAEAEQIGVAFIESDLIAVGPPASVTALLDTRAAGQGSVQENEALMRLVRRVDHASTWTVARFDALRTAPAVPAELASQLPAITWLAASGEVDSGIAATIHAEARDAQAAQDLGEVIRGFVALARMQVGPQPAFGEVLDSLHLSTDGTIVTVGFSLPSHVIDQLGTMARPRVPASDEPVRTPSLGSPSI